MEQTIYGDVLFLINFSMDYLALYLTSKILSLHVKAFRMILSAAAGAIYSVYILFFPGNVFIGTIISVAVSLLICYMAFGANLRTFIRSVILFYLISLLLGGGITALCNVFASLSGTKRVLFNGSVRELDKEIPFALFMVFTSVCVLLCFIGGHIFKRFSRIKTAKLCIINRGKKLYADALCDSGNLLTEPISGRPCIIIPLSMSEGLIPGETKQSIEKNDFSNHSSVFGLRVIPSHSVGHSGMLYGFIPESVTVNGVSVNACVALDVERASFGGYSAILPSRLI